MACGGARIVAAGAEEEEEEEEGKAEGKMLEPDVVRADGAEN